MQRTQTSSKDVLQSLGLKVIDDQPFDFNSVKGKTSYGRLWENPEFTDFEGLVGAVAKAPDAVRVPATQSGIDFGGRSFITVDDKYAATVTDKYHLVQHKEIGMLATEAARSIDLRPVGRIEYEGGRMTGHMVFTGAEQQIQLLKETGEDIAVGAKWFSSYGGDRGLGVETFGISTICCNYNAWGKTLGRVYATHAKPQVEEIEAAFLKMLDASAKLPAIINKAKETVVREEDLVDLLWGVRFPESYILGGKRTENALIPNIKTWNPRLQNPGEELTVFNVYDAATAVLTHGAGISSFGVEAYSQRLNKLFTKSLDFLIDDGKDFRERVMQRRAEKSTEPVDDDEDDTE